MRDEVGPRFFSSKKKWEIAMKFRIFGLVAIAAFAVSCLLGSVQVLAQNAYITNSSSNSVSVIDTATNTVIATIPVGNYPFGVAVIPDGSKVYITNVSSNSVSVIDTASNTVIATIPVGDYPYGVTVTPDGSKVYVANHVSAGTVSVIDTASNTVTATIPGFVLPGPAMAEFPFGVAASPDGSKVYVTNCPGAFSGGVEVIDTATDTATGIIAVAGDCVTDNPPLGVVVTPDGSKVYVGESNGSLQNVRFSFVAVIDTASNTVTAMIPVGPVPSPELGGAVPFGLAVSPDSSKVYVTSETLNTVSVIDAVTNAVTATIPVGNRPIGVSVTPDGSKVYVANAASDSVSVIDTATNAVTASIPVGNDPVAFGVFIGPAPRFAGTPGQPNCHGQSVSALAQQYGGLPSAAAALGYSSVQVLQNAIAEYCAG
jgi:YVTN family beta-propeller protein